MNTSPNAISTVAETHPPISEADFFQNTPPGVSKLVKALSIDDDQPYNTHVQWNPIDLLLYCTGEKCTGYRYYKAVGDYQVSRRGATNLFLRYICKNCNLSIKQYAVSLLFKSSELVEILKYGEVPQYGAPNAQRLLNLMGGEREYYLKGRKCENQGLGIAAFAYYRRVVENQKSKIISEILKIAEKLGSDPKLIADLKAAKDETRFSEAIQRIKHGLPPALLINGHNPLTLLHSALSEGLHATSDEDCLELATSIRVVLSDLVERMATAVKEEKELTSAVQRLLQAGGKR